MNARSSRNRALLIRYIAPVVWISDALESETLDLLFFSSYPPFLACAQGQSAGTGVLGGEEPVVRVLAMFGDVPGPSAVFGIHQIMRAGKELGVVEGQWLSPSQVHV